MGSMIQRNSAVGIRLVVPELLAEHRVIGKARELLANHLLDRLVGLAHRREVGLGRHLQVVGSKARHRDAVGKVGELEGKRQGVGNVHGRSIREARFVPMRKVWSDSWTSAPRSRRVWRHG